MVVTRTGVSIDRDLLRMVDEFVREKNLESRSSLITAALESYMLEHSIEFSRGTAYGAIVVLYKTHEEEAEHVVTESQHEFLDIVMGSLHVHLSPTQCMEVIVVKGPVQRIRDLLGRVLSTRGVLTVKPVLTIVEGEDAGTRTGRTAGGEGED